MKTYLNKQKEKEDKESYLFPKYSIIGAIERVIEPNKEEGEYNFSKYSFAGAIERLLNPSEE